VVNGDYEQALSHLSSLEQPEGGTWTPAQLAKQLETYYADHQYIRLDPEARNARHTYVAVSEDKKFWIVQQVLIDPDDHNDWKAEFSVDLAASRVASEPVIRLFGIASVGHL